MKEQRRVLSVSLDAGIRGTRQRILEVAGFSVQSAADVQSAIEFARGDLFDVVVWCHSLAADLNEFGKELRAFSGAPIVVAANGPELDSHYANRTVDAFHPAELIFAIDDVLAETAAKNNLRKAIDSLKLQAFRAAAS